MLDRATEAKNVPDLTAALRIAPGPWSPRISEQIVARFAKIDRPRLHLSELVGVLAEGLHPSVAPRVQRLASTDDGTTTALQQLAQFLSLVPTITEAFR
jgi:hypothetical protein